MPPTVTPEPGSFRDKTGRVFYLQGRVCRALSAEALAHWNLLQSKRFFQRFIKAEAIIPTRAVNDPPPQSSPTPWVGVLEHDAIPFITYPYEWSFGMLRDAALLHLDLLEAALPENMILKDATPYNVQWRGTHPVFIDIPSFVPWQPGTPWIGYGQFCQLFLNPLLLQSLRGVPYHAWLRGAIDGITPEHLRKLLPISDWLRPGVLSHVVLHSHLRSQFSGSSRQIRQDLAGGGFGAELILANVRRLRKILEGLSWQPRGSTWSRYDLQRNYSDADYEAKNAFVESVVRNQRRRLTWDIGCNSGDFSTLAAGGADQVIAMDADAWVIETLYRELKRKKQSTILPLVMNLADASPNLGWRGRERKSLSDRTQPNLILALALVHHIAITANIPLEEFIDFLSSFRADLVIEFVSPEDEMVQRLLRNKDSRHEDYRQDYFESLLEKAVSVQKRLPLRNGSRTLYYAVPK